MLNNATDPAKTAVAIDHVYDLQHNTDTVFNKIKSYYDANKGYKWIKEMLDFKANAKSIRELLPFVSSKMKKLALPILKDIENKSQYSKQAEEDMRSVAYSKNFDRQVRKGQPFVFQDQNGAWNVWVGPKSDDILWLGVDSKEKAEESLPKRSVQYNFGEPDKTYADSSLFEVAEKLVSWKDIGTIPTRTFLQNGVKFSAQLTQSMSEYFLRLYKQGESTPAADWTIASKDPEDQVVEITNILDGYFINQSPSKPKAPTEFSWDSLIKEWSDAVEEDFKNAEKFTDSNGNVWEATIEPPDMDSDAQGSFSLNGQTIGYIDGVAPPEEVRENLKLLKEYLANDFGAGMKFLNALKGETKQASKDTQPTSYNGTKLAVSKAIENSLDSALAVPENIPGTEYEMLATKTPSGISVFVYGKHSDDPLKSGTYNAKEAAVVDIADFILSSKVPTQMPLKKTLDKSDLYAFAHRLIQNNTYHDENNLALPGTTLEAHIHETAAGEYQISIYDTSAKDPAKKAAYFELEAKNSVDDSSKIASEIENFLKSYTEAPASAKKTLNKKSTSAKIEKPKFAAEDIKGLKAWAADQEWGYNSEQVDDFGNVWSVVHPNWMSGGNTAELHVDGIPTGAVLKLEDFNYNRYKQEAAEKLFEQLKPDAQDDPTESDPLFQQAIANMDAEADVAQFVDELIDSYAELPMNFMGYSVDLINADDDVTQDLYIDGVSYPDVTDDLIADKILEHIKNYPKAEKSKDEFNSTNVAELVTDEILADAVSQVSVPDGEFVFDFIKSSNKQLLKVTLESKGNDPKIIEQLAILKSAPKEEILATVQSILSGYYDGQYGGEFAKQKKKGPGPQFMPNAGLSSITDVPLAQDDQRPSLSTIGPEELASERGMQGRGLSGIQMMPADEDAPKTWIGRAEPDSSHKTMWARLGKKHHYDYGMGSEGDESGNWRLNPGTGVVFWWGETPNKKQQSEVEKFLAAQGIEVAGHDYMDKYNPFAEDVLAKAGFGDGEQKPAKFPRRVKGKIKYPKFMPADEDFAKKLTQDDVDALQNYSGAGTGINAILRNEGDQQLGGYTEDVKRLDAMFSIAPKLEGKTLFRAIEKEVLDSILAENDEWVDRGFVSTSASRKGFKEVLSDFEGDGAEDLVELVITANVPGIRLTDASNPGSTFNYQDEMLLPRNMRFKVRSNEGNRVFVDASLPNFMPNNPSPAQVISQAKYLGMKGDYQQKNALIRLFPYMAEDIRNAYTDGYENPKFPRSGQNWANG
jgi:hypothetical protein